MDGTTSRGSRLGSIAARLGIAAAVVGVLYLLRPGVVENGVRSPRVWAAVAGALIASRLVMLVVQRVTGRVRTAAVAGNLVLAVIGAILLAPSFQQRTVEEPFPEIAAAAADAASTTAAPTTAAPMTAAPMSAAPMSAAPMSAAPMAAAPVTAAPMAAAPPPAPPAPPAPPGPRALSSAELDGVGHSASGRVTLYAVDDELVLRFEDVDIEGTPGPYVHLVPAGDRSPDDGQLLGPLTAERGSFSYSLPDGVDASGSWTVLVWCRPFSTPVAAADLDQG